ncbi:hypothetical protein CCH79_00014901, partial [Gambusia affinis]
VKTRTEYTTLGNSSVRCLYKGAERRKMVIATGTNPSSDAFCSPLAQISGHGALIYSDPQTLNLHRQHAKGQKIRRVAFLGQVNWMAIAQRCHYSMRSGAETHWTLPAVIVLWTSLWAIASSFPTPNRTNATLIERKWETLFSRSYLGVNGGRSQLNWQSDYLQGIKRVRRLYCNVGIGFHLQVLPDGRISGLITAHKTEHHPSRSAPARLHPSLLHRPLQLVPKRSVALTLPPSNIVSHSGLIEISTVDRGVISLFGVRSQLFVAMNSRGRLYGTSHFKDECKFKETLLPNNYNAYESFVYKGFHIGLSKHGRVKRGNKATTAMTVTHFLPRL